MQTREQAKQEEKKAARHWYYLLKHRMIPGEIEQDIYHLVFERNFHGKNTYEITCTVMVYLKNKHYNVKWREIHQVITNLIFNNQGESPERAAKNGEKI